MSYGHGEFRCRIVDLDESLRCDIILDNFLARRSLELKSVVVDMNHHNSKKAGERRNLPAKTIFLPDLQEANLIKNDANDAEMIS